MVYPFVKPDDYQPAFPGFPQTIPDFSASAVPEMLVKVAGAVEADIYNTRLLKERERHARLEALKERVQAAEQMLAQCTDLIGLELNLMGRDS